MSKFTKSMNMMEEHTTKISMLIGTYKNYTYSTVFRKWEAAMYQEKCLTILMMKLSTILNVTQIGQSDYMIFSIAVSTLSMINLFLAKIQRHFAFKTCREIVPVEDHFSIESCDSFKKTKDSNNSQDNFENEETKIQNYNENTNKILTKTKSHECDLLIERNAHIWKDDNFEDKFKLLYVNKNNEFFKNTVEKLYDSFDRTHVLRNKDMLTICNDLVEKYPLNTKTTNGKHYFDQLREKNYVPEKIRD